MEALEADARLASARAANRPGSGVPHTVVVLPSYSVENALLAHYGRRIPALEHRQLLTMLMLPRLPHCELIFVTAQRPTERVLAYYLSFVADELREDTRARTHVVEVPDAGPRSITAKLLDRPDLLATIRSLTRGRVAFIEPWNVTHSEMEVAQRLGLPLNGTPANLWPLGFKSSGRRILREAAVPLPVGREDVRTVADLLWAIESIRQQQVGVQAVVVKLDNSGTGIGNRVVRFADASSPAQLRAAIESLGPDYLSDLAFGAVVEELVTGHRFASPSVQVDIEPGGRAEVISTHEQLQGGPDGQTYAGCLFPAVPSYRHHLMAHGEAVGKLLADRGAIGRFSVDFAATRASASSPWQLYGLEINLRRSGTSHPMSLLHNLVPGHYDGIAGTWSVGDGSQRCYRSTDNLVDPAWRGRPAVDVIDAIDRAGLAFDQRHGVGVVLHMLNGLEIDGVVGLTTIGHSPADAQRLYRAAVEALRLPRDAGVTHPG